MQNNIIGVKGLLFKAIAVCTLMIFSSAVVMAQSTRQERRLINNGNSLYKEGKFTEALLKYKEALASNASSDVAKFNMGLTQIRLSERSGKEERDSVAEQLYAQGSQLLQQVAQLGSKKPDLSSKANYNLGNLQFEKEDYSAAIRYYKEALRLNPNYENARRNLRIAQLRQQNQQDQNNQDQNQDQNKDQDKQDQDKKDQDKQDQNQDQDKQDQDKQDQDKQDQDKQDQQPRENEINTQAAQQILNAVENNEAQLRMRKGTEKGDKKGAMGGGSQKKW